MCKLVFLKGGLGNVLFQDFYSTTLGKDTKLSSKLTEKNIYTRILQWQIHDKSYSELVQSRIVSEGNLWRFLLLLISKISKSQILGHSYGITKCNLRSSFFMGYYQEKKFILNNKDKFKDYLIRLSRKLEHKNNIEVVCHVRLGDTNHFDENLFLKDLILEGIDEVLFVTDNPLILINSGINTSRVRKGSVLEDFTVITSAKKKLYCSNSTLSWWGAHLTPKSCEIYMPRKLHEQLGFYGDNKLTII